MIPTECPWRDTLYWYDTVDSTNSLAKQAAAKGAPQGTVIVAGHQSAGRGRLGRSFHSPGNKGLYFSAILRPECKPEALMHLTCAVGTAVCDAIEEVSDYRPGLKWINDLVAGKKKLGGILTELQIDPATQLVSSAIIGIGINCLHTTEDFPQELQGIATSIYAATGKSVSPWVLAAAVTKTLWKLSATLLDTPEALMKRYRKDCITLGQDIVLIRGDEKRYGRAIGIDNTGSLLVQFENHVEAVNSGEVSIRGMYGYV